MKDLGTRISRDYKARPPAKPPSPKSSPLHWFVFGAALPILSLSFALHMGDAAAMRQMIEPGVGDAPIVMDEEQSEGILRLTAQTLDDILGDTRHSGASADLLREDRPFALNPTDDPFVDPDWISLTVTAGDSLSRIFERFELAREDLRAISQIGNHKRYLRDLQPGDEFRIKIDDGGRIAELVHDVDPLKTLHLTRSGEQFKSELITHPVERRPVTAHGVVRSSLIQAGTDAGLSYAAVMQFAQIFGYEIDFALDLREGDELTVVYEAGFRDGEKVVSGPILAASFKNQGKTYKAIRYGNDDQGRYYAPDGTSLRKAFLRTPVDFSRISSGFNLGRRHPILNTIRAHKGVDYAAPQGTAIKAAGDGKVIFQGRKGGYGNVVEIAHGKHHSTLYAHMSGFAKGVTVGATVRAGQTIGYVGSTGLATGPHLHYELRVDGVHRDPLKVNTALADNLTGRDLQAFKQQAAPLLASLEPSRQTQLAQNRTPASTN